MSNQVVLFDLGGVLADLGKPASQMELAMSNEEFWSFWLAYPPVRLFESGKLSAAEFLDAFAGALRISEPADECLQRFLRWQLKLFPGIPRMLARLRKKYDVALLSNTNELHWRMIRKQLDVESTFKHLFLSYEMGCCKPDDDIFTSVIERVSIAPSKILFLDDTEANVDAARQSGMDAMLVKGPSGIQSALVSRGIDDAALQR